MEYKNFSDLVLNRQACRDFNDEPIDLEKIKKAISTGLLAPSACNSQPWKIFCVASEEKRLEVLSALTEGDRNLFLKKAKAFLVLVETEAVMKEDVKKRFSVDKFVKYDIGALSAYLTLALKEEDIDSCIIGWVNSAKLKTALNLPDSQNSSIVIAVGKTDIKTRVKSRKPESDTVEYL